MDDDRMNNNTEQANKYQRFTIHHLGAVHTRNKYMVKSSVNCHRFFAEEWRQITVSMILVVELSNNNDNNSTKGSFFVLFFYFFYEFE